MCTRLTLLISQRAAAAGLFAEDTAVSGESGAESGSEPTGGTRAYGSAIDCILTYLGAALLDGGDNGLYETESQFASVRCMSFLSGLPDCGHGTLAADRCARLGYKQEDSIRSRCVFQCQYRHH